MGSLSRLQRAAPRCIRVAFALRQVATGRAVPLERARVRVAALIVAEREPAGEEVQIQRRLELAHPVEVESLRE